MYRWKQKLIVAVCAAVVVGLFATGVLDWRRFLARCFRFFHRSRSELAAVADSSEPVKDIRAAQLCRENLMRIESAKRKIAHDRGGTFGRLTEKDILPELPRRKMPRCPAGGWYSINDIGMLPTCSVGFNGTSSREDDHIILNY